MVPDIVCGYKLLRELGTRALPAYAAIDPKPRRPDDALCVVERLAREPGVNAEAAAVFLRDAKRLSQVRHPNLVHVRDVVVGTSTVLLVTDWLDGEVFSDIARMAAEQGIPIPLAGTLRVMLDLLEGLSALHEVRDAKREPLQIVHAEVAPRNIVVGVDGRAVLVHPLHLPAEAKPNHAPDVIGYLAPEVLLGDQTADQRADVYGAGVILWEALTGQRMHGDGDDAGEIVMRILGGRSSRRTPRPTRRGRRRSRRQRRRPSRRTRRCASPTRRKCSRPSVTSSARASRRRSRSRRWWRRSPGSGSARATPPSG